MYKKRGISSANCGGVKGRDLCQNIQHGVAVAHKTMENHGKKGRSNGTWSSSGRPVSPDRYCNIEYCKIAMPAATWIDGTPRRVYDCSVHLSRAMQSPHTPCSRKL